MNHQNENHHSIVVIVIRIIIIINNNNKISTYTPPKVPYILDYFLFCRWQQLPVHGSEVSKNEVTKALIILLLVVSSVWFFRSL
jgi:hypothetical protein